MNALKFPPTPLRLLAIAGLTAICCTSVMAQDALGPYIGGSLGSTRANFNNDAINSQFVGNGFTVRSSDTNNRSSGGKLFGGYQFTPNFAVEGGYFDLGRFSYSGTTTGGAYNGDTRANGLNLDLVGTLPLTEQFSILGRVGAAFAQTRSNFSSTGFVPANTSNRSRNDTSVKFGIGLQYAITDALSLRAELERYRINDPIRNRSNVDMASIGLIYRFGPKVQTPVAKAYVAPPAPAPVYVAPAPVVVAPAPVVVAPPPPPVYVPPARPAKEGRN